MILKILKVAQHQHVNNNFFFNERTFSEQAHDTPRLPAISYWQQQIHEI
jgi:hypothetical protein